MKAYECDRCGMTFVGDARNISDLSIIGTPFTLRFSFGMKRTEEERQELRQQAQEHPLVRMFGSEQMLGEDQLENVAADLCDPCRAALLKEAVELAGLELHE